MALSSKEYWEKRSLERLTEAEKASIPYIRKVRKIYEDSARSITESVKKMYTAYYRRQENDGTGRFDSAKLNEIIPSGDIKRFQKAMRAAGLSTRLPSYYKGRMTRAELLEAQIWAEIQKAAENEQELSTQSYKNTISNSYYRSIYDYSKLTSSDQAFSKLNDRSMNRILNSKLAGDDYSSRIWKSSDKLADSIKNIMGKAIATGQPLEKTTRDVMQRFDVKKYEAERLIRTETNYFENYAEIESYEEMGIDHFIFMATLDGRTSEICREMDGKVFKVKDARQGDNVPPLHPYCRSTIAPYLGKEYAPTERRARGMQEDGKTQIVKFQSFQSWADNNGIDNINKTAVSARNTTKPYDNFTIPIKGSNEFKKETEHLSVDITKKELSSITTKNIRRYKFDKNDSIDSNEKLAALIVEKELKIELKHFPRIKHPEEIESPDFASSKYGILVEVKNPRSYKNGIEAALRKSRKQILAFHEDTEKSIVVIDVSLINDEPNINKRRDSVINRAKYLHIRNIVVTNGNRILYKDISKNIKK